MKLLNGEILERWVSGWYQDGTSLSRSQMRQFHIEFKLQNHPNSVPEETSSTKS